VQFLPAEEADSLTLFFNRQCVRITGKKLRELVSALQRMAVEWVKERSEQFNSIGSSGGAWIERIQIMEATSSPVPKLKE